MLSNNSCIDVDYPLSYIWIRGLSNKPQDEKYRQPPLLCIHGWLDNAASFMPLMAAFNEQPIIAIDLAGHGLSSHRSADAFYHFIDNIYDIFELFEFNQWPALNIVGHSMGGMIASAFAAAFPEKVKSLTLIDSIGFVTSDADKATENIRQGMLSRFALASKTRQREKVKPLRVHTSIDSAIKARMKVSDLHYQSAQLLVNRGMKPVGNGFIWRSDARLTAKSPLRLMLAQADQIISSIQCPVQLLYADKGLDMVKRGVEHYQSLFQHSYAHVLSGGHHVHMEQPQATADLISQFISFK